MRIKVSFTADIDSDDLSQNRTDIYHEVRQFLADTDMFENYRIEEIEQDPLNDDFDE